MHANSKMLVAKAGIQAVHGRDVRSVPGFTRVLLASGKNVDKVFVVFNNLPWSFKTCFASPGQDLLNNIVKLADCRRRYLY